MTAFGLIYLRTAFGFAAQPRKTKKTDVDVDDDDDVGDDVGDDDDVDDDDGDSCLQAFMRRRHWWYP